MAKKSNFGTVFVKNKKSFLLVGLAILVGFVGWETGRYLNLWGEPNELLVIKAEKVAKPNLLGLELASSKERGQGSLVGKTVSPSVQRVFKPKDGDMDATIKQIVKLAEEDGWVYDKRISAQNEWAGKKKSRRFDLVLSIKPSLSNNNLISVIVH